MAEKRVEEFALIELTKHARILQRQFKLMKGMKLDERQRELLKEIITTLETEFRIFRI